MTLAEKLLEFSDGSYGEPKLMDVLVGLCRVGEETFDRLREESDPSALLDERNVTGDTQIAADKFSHEAFLRFCTANEHVRHFVSEEADVPQKVGDGQYSVAVDPLDGSKALKYAVPTGSIFCIFEDANRIEDFSGKNALASGFFVYGLNLELYFTVSGAAFHLTKFSVSSVSSIPSDRPLICANASNFSFWPVGWRNFFESSILSKERPAHNNTRWFGSLVAHAKATLVSGGVFCYPPDTRAGYDKGHLRLIYEAIPMALIFQAAGGRSTNGEIDILDITPSTTHQKTPLAFGNASHVEELKAFIQNI